MHNWEMCSHFFHAQQLKLNCVKHNKNDSTCIFCRSLCVSELALMLMLYVLLATILHAFRHFHRFLDFFSRIAPLNKRDFCK